MKGARLTTHRIFLRRAGVLLAFFVFLILLLLLRVYYLQIVHFEYYFEKANRQYAHSTEFYDRGSIFFSDKDGRLSSAAGIKSGNTLAINPSAVENPERLYKILTEEFDLKINKEDFIAKASKSGDPYEEIIKKIDRNLAQKIKERDLKGVILPVNRWRYYPGSSLASHLIGFVAYKDDSLVGRYGLERYYEDNLKRDPKKLGVNFFAELFSGIKEGFALFDKSNIEASLILSVDPLVQARLEEVLRENKKRWNSKRVSAIIYNPQNGEILAMASEPGFDLNEFKKYDASVFSNPLVENVYEMGSIIKPITMAIALDSGAVKEGATYYDTGSKKYGDKTIYNYDKKARGEVPLQEILSQSLNVGAAWLMEKSGKKTFYDYFKKFALDQESGIDLPNEASNLTSNLESGRLIEFATASFGQGIALTPVSTVRALGALASGNLEHPHVVKALKTESGIVKELDYGDYSKKVLSDKTVESVSRMLVEVVDSALEKGKRKKERYAIAAKTGTAQIARPEGGYYKDKYNHTFFGYFPAFQPRFLIFLINEEPQGALYASQTLTDPFYEMVDFLINYYNIEPDR